MTDLYRVAVIGAGLPWGAEGAAGWGMAHRHAYGYQETGRCRLVAVADINRENAEFFASQFGSPAVYVDYQEMLERERLEIVSVCTRLPLHAPMVIACAQAGAKAIHCEKPMAPTWDDARRMVAACEQAGTQLTFNHQHRFHALYSTPRDLLREGLIGELRRVEAACSDIQNSHWPDLCFFYNGDAPARWVLAQMDIPEPRPASGVARERQGITQIMWANGVRGMIFTGEDADIGCTNRMIGTEGVIEVRGQRPRVRLRGRGDADWRGLDIPDDFHGNQSINTGVADLIDALEHGREPELSARKTLQTTEAIFAAFESSRRRARVDLPLTLDDCGGEW
jgi:UDP-N-acetylglucosamine 3-dehydrogenase